MIHRALPGLSLALAILSLGWLPAEAFPLGSPIRTVAERPAATLLLPYFEVDLGDPNGLTTQLAIGNAANAATVAHVTVWSDLAVPVLDFDVYLTGFDLVSIDLRDVLAGSLPQTADGSGDPGDLISPQGPFSQDVPSFPGCAGRLPPPPLSAADVGGLRAALTGQPSSLAGGQCCGRNLGDTVARGFVTVDAMNSCAAGPPGSPGYFVSGGVGLAGNQNVLWGDFTFLRTGRNPLSAGGPLVHVAADAADPEASVAGQYTFYGSRLGWTADDNRLPLATTFAARYINLDPEDVAVPDFPFTRGTTVVVWRDPKVNQGPFACDALPFWHPLVTTDIVAFNEQEEVSDIPEIPPVLVFPAPTEPAGRLPAASQAVSLSGDQIPVPFNSGWLYLNLNHTLQGTPEDPLPPEVALAPPENPSAAQAWVFVLHDAGGRLSSGHNALPFDSAAAISGSGVIFINSF